MTNSNIENYNKLSFGQDNISFGQYKLNKLLGVGGMAKVYAATHEFMKRQVALKIIEDEDNKTNVLRFFQEIKTVAKLNHSNIVTIYDAGKVNNKYYYTMELLSGLTLKNYVDEKKMLEERKALEIVLSLAQALKYAHINNVVHRDIKPENVIFDKNGVPKLIDFGIAMYQNNNLTQEGTILGSLHYASPEQIKGNCDIDYRTDIYSLGATLYYMLTGSTIFSNCSSQELIIKHISGISIRSPRKFNRKISQSTLNLIKKMMKVNREKRSSIEEIIITINSILNKRPKDLTYTIIYIILAIIGFMFLFNYIKEEQFTLIKILKEINESFLH